MQPKSIDRTPEGIQIRWQDDHLSLYPATYLRQRCPCAICKEQPQASTAPVGIRRANPMGWYALQFVFSDGHDTGIYSYEMLRKICPCPTCSKTV